MKVKDFVCEANWTQGEMCRDKDGNPFKYNWPYNPDVCKWDLVGMILYCYREDGDVKQQEILQIVRDKVGHTPKWNDSPGRTWEDVRDLAMSLDI